MNEVDFSEITRLNEKYSKDPKSRIFVQLADLYRKNNMVDEALEVLNKGLEYHPEYPVAYLILGKCYYDKRSYIQARDAFEKTITLDPQNIIALRMLAKTCETLKDEKGQINAYRNIIAIDPLDNNAKEKLSMLEALQRKEPMYTVAMAEEYEKQDNLEEALKIYEHLLFTDPSDLFLNQKISELKKIAKAEKEKLETSKIEEMQVEPVFKAEDFKQAEQEEESTDIEQPETHIEDKRDQTANSEIQSLEDFLVEELEQAAQQKATESEQEERAEPPESTLPQESASTDAIVRETTESEERVEEATRQASNEPAIEEPPKLIEESSLAEQLLKEEDVTTQRISSEQDVEEPVVPEEKMLHETHPAPEEETGTRDEEQMPIIETAPSEETERPKETYPAAEEVPDERTAAETPSEPIAPEKEEKPESKEEPIKSKEEDFKSFQEWLSGLLK
jgi:tetratricopeptide (TPR) repeat protein